jgi:hypothetical protein
MLEPGCLTGPDAATLYRMFAAVERLAMAGKTLLAPRIDESGVWRDGGHRSPAVMLADLEGVPTGQARNILEVGHRLPQLPGTEEALRSGTLSGPKVVELSGAAVLDPDNEADLLAGSADQPLQKVKERCQRARATSAHRDPVDALRRIHAARHFSSWTDSEGAFCYQGRDTADRGARILDRLEYATGQMRRSRKAASGAPGGTEHAEPSESDGALRADAFFLFMTGGAPVPASPGRHASDGVGRSRPSDGRPASGPPVVDPAVDPAVDSGDDDPGPSPGQIALGLDGVPDEPPDRPGPAGRPPAPDVVDRPPTCTTIVRIDLDALCRGDAAPGELCEIDGQGPVPVAMARSLADDSYLRLVFHRAGDIRAVSHFGRTINRALRTALAYRDRCCVVPGCGVAYGLEIDHIAPFATGGPTSLQNLALLCHHHHWLKTYEGWTLERTGPSDEDPRWTFTPQPAFGEEPGLGSRGGT